MYETFFGLKHKPFSLTSDPAFLFLTPQHREALAGLAYAILGRKGLVVLIGEAGTGKTTLLFRLLQQLPPTRLRSSVILNPTLTPSEFFELALLNLGFTDVPTSKAQRLHVLQRLLLESKSRDQVVALVVDEAHKLNPETLEEIRLLSNFEAAAEKLLQIILIGQPELNTVLNAESLRQLKQRIPLRLSIQPLAAAEVASYIACRWKIAGGSATPPFQAEAMVQVAEYSRGIPRVINAICDNALITALGKEHKTVTIEDVYSAASELDLVTPIPTRQPVLVAPRHDAETEPIGQAELEAQHSDKASRWRWARKLSPSHGTNNI